MFFDIVFVLIGLSLIVFPRQIYSWLFKTTLKVRRKLSKLLGVQEGDIPLWIFGFFRPDAPKLWIYRVFGLIFIVLAVYNL
jgi:hypothetical protein